MRQSDRCRLTADSKMSLAVRPRSLCSLGGPNCIPCTDLAQLALARTLKGRILGRLFALRAWRREATQPLSRKSLVRQHRIHSCSPLRAMSMTVYLWRPSLFILDRDPVP